MKNILFLFLSLGLTPKIACAQAGLDTTYNRIPGYADNFHALVVDDDTLVIMQVLHDTTYGTQGMNLIKMDTLGNELSNTFLTDSLYKHIPSLFGNKLIPTSDGGYAYGASYLGNPDYPGGGVFLAKYNHAGEIDFVKYYHRPNDTTTFFAINNLLQLEDGGYFLFSFYSDGSGPGVVNFTPHLIRTDPMGNELWSRDYDAGGDTTLMFHDAISVSANKFVVAGAKFYIHSSAINIYEYDYIKPYTASLDSLGNITHFVFDDVDSILVVNVIAASDGGYIQTIEKSEKFTVEFRSKAGVRKLDSNFVQEWIWYSDYEPSSPNTMRTYIDLVKTPDGNYVGGGSAYQGWNLPALHVKISEAGELIWERWADFAHKTDTSGTVIFAEDNQPRAMGVLSSGSTVSVGSTWLPYERGWLLRISPGGCVYEDTIGCWAGAVAPDATDRPLSLSDIQVYPNPVNDELTVFLPDAAHPKATIYLYDAMGRFLRKQRVRSGRNRLIISDLPKGMVFYTILSEKGILGNGKLIVEH